MARLELAPYKEGQWKLLIIESSDRAHIVDCRNFAALLPTGPRRVKRESWRGHDCSRVTSLNGVDAWNEYRRSAGGCIHVPSTLENDAIHESHERQEVLEKPPNESTKSVPRLFQIIDTIPSLAWCHLPDGSNEFLNERWHQYTGVSREAARGEGWKIAIHPEDLPGLMAKWATLRDHRTAGECEARLRRSDGIFL